MYNPQITVDRITSLRNEKNIPLNALNEACELNKNTIKASANSKNGLSSAFLYEIANYLNCSVDYLLGRTDNPNLTNSISNSNTTINGTQANIINSVNSSETIDEMTNELLKIFKTLPFMDRLDVLNKAIEKSKK